MLPKHKANKLEKVKCPQEEEEETKYSLVFHVEDKKNPKGCSEASVLGHKSQFDTTWLDGIFIQTLLKHFSTALLVFGSSWLRKSIVFCKQLVGWAELSGRFFPSFMFRVQCKSLFCIIPGGFLFFFLFWKMAQYKGGPLLFWDDLHFFNRSIPFHIPTFWTSWTSSSIKIHSSRHCKAHFYLQVK